MVFVISKICSSIIKRRVIYKVTIFEITISFAIAFFSFVIKVTSFDELITLLETKKHIKAKYIKQVKNLYKWLNKDLEKCREKMIAFGDIYEDENFDEEYAKLELIRSYLHCYQDDWKIDYDSLNHFLSEALEQTFEITFEEAQHEFARIKNKVETESDYTLLYVDTGCDNFYCLVCPKSAETRIIEIADILNLPINH